ncbi:MAG: hypothetical protein HGA19_01150 [Oscillochloris sp.]|nr:hypothetical protein [Oscillochloris sp.]
MKLALSFRTRYHLIDTSLDMGLPIALRTSVCGDDWVLADRAISMLCRDVRDSVSSQLNSLR